MKSPAKVRKGKPICCVVNNNDGRVMGMYRNRQDADSACKPFRPDMRVESYVQKPSKESTDQLLSRLCKKFVKDNNISCAEAVYQCDRVSARSLEFIEKIAQIIGYAGR